ncbi:hypothetical protein V3C99_015022, partial [Haemonchus contortus]
SEDGTPLFFIWLRRLDDVIRMRPSETHQRAEGQLLHQAIGWSCSEEGGGTG